MSAKKKTAPPELAFEATREWLVVPKFRHLTKNERAAKIEPELSHYELQFDHVCQEKATSEHGAQRLRELATLCNRLKLSPRRRVECAADAPNPQEYLRKLSK